MKNPKHKIPPVKEWTGGVIIDTGPLLIALASHLQFASQVSESISDRILQNVTGNDPSMRDVGVQRNLLAWLKPQRVILTTAHVLAELRGHIPKGIETTFWETIIEFWREFKVEEKTLRLQEKWSEEPFRDMLGKIGPTDTAIIALADEQRLPILTSDYRTLAKSAKEIGAKVLPLKDFYEDRG